VALIPQEELKFKDGGKQPSGFHLVYLPFADDLRNVPVGTPLLEPETEQLDAAKGLIKKLRIRYHTAAFENPDLQAHYSLIESLGLNR